MNDRTAITFAAPAAPAGIVPSLAEDAQTGLFVVQHGSIAYANPMLAQMLGRSVAQLIGQPHEVTVAEEFRAHAQTSIARRLAGKEGRPGQVRCQRADGNCFDARVLARRIEHRGQPAVLVTLIDITEVQDALRRAEWNAGMLARTEALCRAGSFELSWPSGLLTASAGLCELLGLPPGTADLIDALGWVPPDEQAFVAGIWRSAVPGEPFEFQHRVLRSDGRRLIVLHRGVLAEIEAGDSLRGVATLQDITAQREAEQRIQELASHDEVTGLPNRAWLLDQVDAAMHAARWESRGFALLALDVPRIAAIKASMGFGAGDTLAMALAARLREACNPGEVVAHLGDTEFALMVELGADAGDAILQRAQTLQRAVQAPVRLGSSDAFSLCLIGIAVFPADGDTPENLLQAAQTARLDVAGGAGVAFFRPESTTRALREMHLEGALRHAVERRELALHYQPQVDLASGAICGAEALLRWDTLGLGPIAPAEFIPIAERTGLIGAIGEWVMQQACEQIAAWQRAGVPAVRIGINLSPLQLQRPDFAQQLQAMLSQTGAPASSLGVELTESMLMDDFEQATAVLRSIKAIGVEISLDDFGTGYSSLNRLSRLPIDVVKVDRSFVHDVTAAPQQVSVTRAIIKMAHGLQMKVLAEGVETEGQLSLLASQGCDQVQGYWFSRPVPAAALATMLLEGKQLPERFTTRARRSRTLLLVDDEDNILSALKRLLRRDGYNIVTATSAAEGLQRLTEREVDVIVSDQRMPGMTGVEFLHRAKALYPHTVRIVLSGYTELQSIIDAVNEGAIYKFLTKPWDDERLRGHVAEAFSQKEMADENRRLAHQVELANGELAALNQKLERQAGLLRASAEGSRSLLDDLPVAVLGVDPDGIIAYANRAAPPGLLGSLAGPERAHHHIELLGRKYPVLSAEITHAGSPRGRLLVLLPGAAQQ
jgi:diguanylate cyclase (GGDEF)-like protein/PAS domain S-box-containing protein